MPNGQSRIPRYPFASITGWWVFIIAFGLCVLSWGIWMTLFWALVDFHDELPHGMASVLTGVLGAVTDVLWVVLILAAIRRGHQAADENRAALAELREGQAALLARLDAMEERASAAVAATPQWAKETTQVIRAVGRVYRHQIEGNPLPAKRRRQRQRNRGRQEPGGAGRPGVFTEELLEAEMRGWIARDMDAGMTGEGEPDQWN